ncbi:hypothetical protein F9K33_14235 [bacterium]|nr:MAG: hypothetical protein F9K33_14235 [bacterium]
MKRILLMLLFVLTSQFMLVAQEQSNGSAGDEEELKKQVEGINKTLLDLKTTVDALKKLKISGYIQAQYQVADTAFGGGWNVGNFAGGNFSRNSDNRYLLRRGRVKFAYENDLTKFVVQIDVTPAGVGIKDAYFSVIDPWQKTVSLTAGVFDRPFGYEISYSSSQRESPERSRMFQTLFPGERDLGAKIEIKPRKGVLNHFNLKAGWFNGMRENANENDSKKDFIGRFGFTLPLQEKKLTIDGGVSLYRGSVTSLTKGVYIWSATGDSFATKNSKSDSLKAVSRQYIGADLQIYFEVPVLGKAALRGEYITGDQPSTQTSNSFYAVTADTRLYKRNVAGYYVNYVQHIGPKNQLVLKYDVFDPNTKVSTKDFTSVTSGNGTLGRQLTGADIRFNTMGFGWIYHWDSNVKFTIYYEKVWNEKTGNNISGDLARYNKDLKDNIFTLRMQYRF